MTYRNDGYGTLDSSLWVSNQTWNAHNSRENGIYLGVVRSSVTGMNGYPSYEVEINLHGRMTTVTCMLMSRYFNTLNFEEYNLSSYLKGTEQSMASYYTNAIYKPGDTVVVTFLNGDPREALVLGCVPHGGKKSTIKPDKPAYRSRFNGVETKIGEDGTYQVIWNGVPKNLTEIQKFDINSVKPIPEPQFDEKLAGSFIGIDTKGSLTLSDAGAEKPQFIKIVKDKHKISMVSGEHRIEIGAATIAGDDAVGIKAKNLKASTEAVSVKTKTAKIQADKMSLTAKKVAIGTKSIELLDMLVKLVDALGQVTALHSMGPCSPLNLAPQWSQVLSLKQKIQSITGSIEDADELTSVEDENLFQQH